MKNIISFLSFSAFCCIFSGCQSHTPKDPGLTYISMAKMPIPVSNVSISVSPCVREQCSALPIPLSQMIKQWASEYWQPTGGAYELHFCIEKIDLQEEVLACPFEPQKWIAVRNSDIFKASLCISCRFSGPNGKTISKTDFKIHQEQYVPENYTLRQRKLLWNQICEQLINQLTIETKIYLPTVTCRLTGVQS